MGSSEDNHPNLVPSLDDYVTSLPQRIDRFSLLIKSGKLKPERRGGVVLLRQRFDLSARPDIQETQVPPFQRYLSSLYFSSADLQGREPLGIFPIAPPYETLETFGIQVATYLAQQGYHTTFSLVLRPNSPLVQAITTPTPQEASELPQVEHLWIPFL